MVKIIGIKCKDKFYITKDTDNNYNRYQSTGKYLINGKIPESTFMENWLCIESEPEIVQYYKSQPNINYRYELIDPKLESEKTPLSLVRDEVATYDDDDYEWCWKEPYRMYRSMYQEVSDKQENTLELEEFEYKTIMEVNNLIESNGFAYDVQRTQWSHEGLSKLTEKDVNYQLLDKIIFPTIVLPSRPCELTPLQTYKIVRQYVKQNINYDFASITSDYNFCFTVKKKIPLSELETFTVDVNLFKKTKRTKMETRHRRYREIECFNMTGENYGGYKQIKGFQGGNQEDLKNKIDTYCRELIKYINEPVEDCEHCKGRGVKEVKNII